MHKIKDLCVVTRTYTQNGQEKKVWKNVGGVYVNDEGHERIAIDAFFNFSALRQDNSDRVWLSAFTPTTAITTTAALILMLPFKTANLRSN